MASSPSKQAVLLRGSKKQPSIYNCQMMHMKILVRYILFTCLMLPAAVHAQNAEQIFKAAGSPAHPKVEVSWNKYYDHAGITALCKRIATAYPNLAKLE